LNDSLMLFQYKRLMMSTPTNTNAFKGTMVFLGSY